MIYKVGPELELELELDMENIYSENINDSISEINTNPQISPESPSLRPHSASERGTAFSSPIPFADNVNSFSSTKDQSNHFTPKKSVPSPFRRTAGSEGRGIPLFLPLPIPVSPFLERFDDDMIEGSLQLQDEESPSELQMREKKPYRLAGPYLNLLSRIDGKESDTQEGLQGSDMDLDTDKSLAGRVNCRIKEQGGLRKKGYVKIKAISKFAKHVNRSKKI
jgi:hypothetical protein